MLISTRLLLSPLEWNILGIKNVCISVGVGRFQTRAVFYKRTYVYPKLYVCLYRVFIKVNTIEFLCGIYLSDMETQNPRRKSCTLSDDAYRLYEVS